MRTFLVFATLVSLATVAACSDGTDSLDTSQSDEALHRRRSRRDAGADALAPIDAGTPKPPATDAGSGNPPPTTNCSPAPGSSTVVDAKSAGATGDGSTDDTAALQRAVTQAANASGTVSIPGGTYMIDGLKSVKVPSNVTIKLASDATLKVIPNSSPTYSALQVTGSNVNIIGGTIEGDRAQHQGSDGEWGMGVNILGGKNVVVEGVTAKELWGDGFYVGSESSNITLCGVSSLHNRRQGLSITSVDGMVVKDSTFNDTDGTPPETGIDIEPNSGGVAQNVQILNSTLSGNTRQGFLIYGEAGQVSNVTLDGNTVSNNRLTGINFQFASGGRITNNHISNNGGDGISLEENTTGVTVSGNVITGSGTPISDSSGGNNSISN